jgi:hypothetical protein
MSDSMSFIDMNTIRLGLLSPETNSQFVWGMVQGGSNMTGTNCDLFTHKSSQSYFNHLVRAVSYYYRSVYLQRVDVTSEQLCCMACLNAHQSLVTVSTE